MLIAISQTQVVSVAQYLVAPYQLFIIQKLHKKKQSTNFPMKQRLKILRITLLKLHIVDV